MKTIEKIRERLYALSDSAYKDFHSKLIPTVDPDTILGVRTPDLRKFAKELAKSEEAKEFIAILPHTCYEENNLHAFLLETEKDYDRLISLIDDFLPYVDNWATCDMFSPKALKKNLPGLYEKILQWISSSHTYTVRFGIGMLMRYYLDDMFSPAYLELVASIHSEEYYVNMMIAWFFCTALTKQYDSTLPYFTDKKLDVWIHNKAIQKALESNRIEKETKLYLKTLRL